MSWSYLRKCCVSKSLNTNNCMIMKAIFFKACFKVLIYYYDWGNVNPSLLADFSQSLKSGHLDIYRIMFTRHLNLVSYDELRVITGSFIDWLKIYGWNVLLSLLSPPCACMFWPLRSWTRKFCGEEERLCNFNFCPRGSC